MKAAATRAVAKGIAGVRTRTVSNTAIVLRAVSSAFISTMVASAANCFEFGQRPTSCQLVFRRVVCRALLLAAAKRSTNAVALGDGSCTLSRIVIGKRHPLMGIRRKGLSCSLSRLAAREVIGGTCRVLRRLPNMRRVGNGLSLTNARGLGVVLGKEPAAVDRRRLAVLLGGAPTSHMRGTRVVCDAPPRCRMENTTVGLLLGNCHPRRDKLRKRIGTKCLCGCEDNARKKVDLLCAAPG